MAQPTSQQIGLKRSATPLLLLFFVTGDMIGGGIYALTGKVGAVVGGAIWSAFLLALVLALFTAFAYAELVTKYPRAGGTPYYIHRAFKSPFFSFMVAFAVVIAGISSAATLATAFAGEYLSPFFTAPKRITGFIFIIVVGFVNFRGITESLTLNAVFTVIELLGLLLILIIGVDTLVDGQGEPARVFDFKEGVNVPMAIVAGAALAFYALIGFEDSVNIVEETQNPGRNFPRIMFTGIGIAGLIYLLVTGVAAMVVPIEQLAGSSGPLLEVIRVSDFGVPLNLFALIALFALANGALINMIMVSRLLYGMAGEGVVPAALARVHPTRQTPWVAILFTSIIALALVATGDISVLASTTVMLLLFAFIAVNVAVLVLRRDSVEQDHFRAPAIFPLLGILVSLGLLTQQSADIWLRTAVLLSIGALLYGVNVLAKNR